MFSGARLYDSCVVTRTGDGAFSLSRHFLSFSLSYPSSYPSRDIKTDLDGDFTAFFLRCQVPLLLWDIIVRVCGILGHAFRTVRLFASRGSCGRGKTDTGGYFCGMSRKVHIKGDYGNLWCFLCPLFARKLKDMTMLVVEYDAKYKNDISEVYHEINKCVSQIFTLIKP